MKIPTENVTPLLKPLDAETAAAALDAGRLGLDSRPAASPPAEAEARRIEHVADAPRERDAGEILLAEDVWNGSEGSARLLPLADVAAISADDSMALDQAVEAILSGLR
ncbi:hypothetical protein sS8_3373 [Methylocaldum marinum]|mgnify:CR=1 FL=1|uniref:Uncharacterized protein n=1 Tax=Methylocaldum marinum TaxID=1432792 RepID=A0A250KWG1_9GAMM|nr:hypothetical protein [Methylocaldum marinum]BBA35311.1 hypothetical protein sS8_3373 [Methylocaldum marinum]